MPLELMKQFQRLYVDLFSRINALRVGSSTTNPGPGNLHVENDLTVEGTIIGGETPSYKTGPNLGGSNPDGTWKTDPNRHTNSWSGGDQGNQPENDYHYGGGWTTLGNGIELAWGWFHSATDGTIGISYTSMDVIVPYRNDPAGPPFHRFPNYTLSVTFDVPGTIGNLDEPGDWDQNPAPGSPGVHRRLTSPHPPGPPDSWLHNHFQPLSPNGFTYNRLNEMDGIVVVHYMAIGY